jgi:hypothetical protein
MNENQRDAPGHDKMLQVLNRVVAQAKSTSLGSIGIQGSIIRWSRVPALGPIAELRVRVSLLRLVTLVSSVFCD